MNYIITKRTECEKCYGKGYYLQGYEDMGTDCPDCDCKGFTDTYHDFDEALLSRLAKLRWDETVMENITREKRLENPRFDGDER